MRGTAATVAVSLLVWLIQAGGCAPRVGSPSDGLVKKEPVPQPPSTGDAEGRRATEAPPPPAETAKGPTSPPPAEPPLSRESATPQESVTVPKSATPQPSAPPPQSVPPRQSPTSPQSTPPRQSTPPQQGTAPQGSAAARPGAQAGSTALDLTSLEKRLRETNAIGVFTKLSLKNQVDDLLEQFRTFHQGRDRAALAKLRQQYDLLLLKVLSLLQDKDPALARDISTSREALWNLLADPAKFENL
jgi:hypothetical protein